METEMMELLNIQFLLKYKGYIRQKKKIIVNICIRTGEKGCYIIYIYHNPHLLKSGISIWKNGKLVPVADLTSYPFSKSFGTLAKW